MVNSVIVGWLRQDSQGYLNSTVPGLLQQYDATDQHIWGRKRTQRQQQDPEHAG